MGGRGRRYRVSWLRPSSTFCARAWHGGCCRMTCRPGRRSYLPRWQKEGVWQHVHHAPFSPTASDAAEGQQLTTVAETLITIAASATLLRRWT